MKEEETEKLNIYEKLSYIQSNIKVPKGHFNDYGGFYYRTCDDIYKAIKPLLKETRTTLQLTDELVNIGDRNYVKATAKLIDLDMINLYSIENVAYAREDETRKGMSGDQLTGSCSSYARKVALNGLLLIDDLKDSDSLKKLKKEKNKDELMEIANQFKIIKKLMSEKNITSDDLFKKYGKKSTDMTLDELKQLIKDLEGEPIHE